MGGGGVELLAVLSKKPTQYYWSAPSLLMHLSCKIWFSLCVVLNWYWSVQPTPQLSPASVKYSSFFQYISLFSYLSCYVIELLQDISVWALRGNFPGRCSAQTFSPDTPVYTACPPTIPHSHMFWQKCLKNNCLNQSTKHSKISKNNSLNCFFRHDTMKHWFNSLCLVHQCWEMRPRLKLELIISRLKM